jgi:hypothetical protein
MQKNAIVPVKPTFLQRLFGRGATRAADPVETAKTVRVVRAAEVGSSGTALYSGYFAEEYLADLVGRPAADIYDKMRRNDGDVKMVMLAIKGLLMKATCEVEPASKDAKHVKQAEHVEHMLFHDHEKDWAETKEEALSFTEFGFFLFEYTHKVVHSHPKFGTYVGLKKLGWRSPRTIERWNLNPDGSLKSVTQYAFGDLSRTIDIPAENLLHGAIGKEGDNYEGVSLLRAAYGAWWRKQLYLKLMAIGAEKNAVPTPVLKVPSGATVDDRATAKEALELYSSNESNYLMLPSGWDFDKLPSSFDPEKMKVCLDYEGTQIARAVLMQFLMLGTGSSSGSWALSTDLSDFALSALEYLADRFASPFNKKLIPELVRLNYGPQDAYPKLKFSGISDKAGKELSELLKNYVDSGVVEPDDELEEHVRKRNGFPKKGTPRDKAADPAEVDPKADPSADPGADPDPKAKAKPPAAEPEPEEKEKPAPPAKPGKKKLAEAKEYRFIRKGSNSCEVCIAFDGKIFPADQAPELPLHPNCECELEPVEDDED